jgi:hypothetical protein
MVSRYSTWKPSVFATVFFVYFFCFVYRVSRKMIRILVTTCVLICASMMGCGGGAARPELVPVSGTVLFKGEPVEGATVTFSNKDAPRSAQGVTDASGKFRLTSYDTNDGAVPGEHAVTITKAAAVEGPAQMTQENAMEMMKRNTGAMQAGNLSDQKPAMVLPEKYADAKTSGETRTVAKGDANDFKFDLQE